MARDRPASEDSDGNGCPTGSGRSPRRRARQTAAKSRPAPIPRKRHRRRWTSTMRATTPTGNGKPDVSSRTAAEPFGTTTSLSTRGQRPAVSYSEKACHTGLAARDPIPCSSATQRSRGASRCSAFPRPQWSRRWITRQARALALIVLTKSGCPSVDVAVRTGAFPRFFWTPCRAGHGGQAVFTWLNGAIADTGGRVHSGGYTMVDANGNKRSRANPRGERGARRTLPISVEVCGVVIGDTGISSATDRLSPPRTPDNMQPCDSLGRARGSLEHDATESAAAAPSTPRCVAQLECVPLRSVPVVMGHMMSGATRRISRTRSQDRVADT